MAMSRYAPKSPLGTPELTNMLGASAKAVVRGADPTTPGTGLLPDFTEDA